MSTGQLDIFKVIHRLEMPGIGDELHHMGWNACSSCFDDPSMAVVIYCFGVRSNNIHVVDTAMIRVRRAFRWVIDGVEIKAKANSPSAHGALSWVYIIISFLGNKGALVIAFA